MTDIQTQIERAVAEERERCAKIADEEAINTEWIDLYEARDAADRIAAAIRFSPPSTPS